MKSADKGLCLCKKYVAHIIICFLITIDVSRPSSGGKTESHSLLQAWKQMDAFLKLNDSIEDIIESAGQLQTSPQKEVLAYFGL